MKYKKNTYKVRQWEEEVEERWKKKEKEKRLRNLRRNKFKEREIDDRQSV